MRASPKYNDPVATQREDTEKDSIVIYIRPGHCNTCKHHLTDGDSPDNYDEHWCYIEENESEGYLPGMHLDHCVFPISSAGEICPCYVTADVVTI
jgi:hypothetical protein